MFAHPIADGDFQREVAMPRQERLQARGQDELPDAGVDVHAQAAPNLCRRSTASIVASSMAVRCGEIDW
jgi:hypothetical protein